MKRQHLVSRRLDIEELEGRLVPSTSVSTNWSGYAVDSNPGTVTSVSGSWVVPAVTGTGTSYSSAWVGIDGDNSPTVEQIGTDSDISNGKATYYAWYEMYPAGSVNLNLKIDPGDTITAQVSYAANGFTLKITDGTQSFSITKKAANAERSSAEWVEEAPSSGAGVLTLADFSSITFKNAQAAIGGTTGAIDDSAWASKVDQIDMESNFGATIATTGSLTDSGSPATSSFTVTYVPTTTTAPTPTPPQRSGGFGGWGWFFWRQTDMTVSSSSDLSSVSLNQVSQILTAPVRQVVSQPANTILSPPVAPLGLTASLGQSGQGSSGNYASPLAIVGGTAEQLLVLPDLPTVDVITPPAVAPATPNPEPLPLLPMPNPLDRNRDTGTTPEASLWAPAAESLPAVIDQSEEERTAVAHPTNLVFGLALAGAWGLSQGRASTERSRKSSKLDALIRDIQWLDRGK